MMNEHEALTVSSYYVYKVRFHSVERLLVYCCELWCQMVQRRRCVPVMLVVGIVLPMTDPSAWFRYVPFGTMKQVRNI